MKNLSVSYREVSDRIYSQIKAIDLSIFPERHYFAGGAIASSILSIIDGVEYPYGDIDIFFSRDQFLEVAELLESLEKEKGIVLKKGEFYDTPAFYRSLKKTTHLGGSQFIGEFDREVFRSSDPMDFLDTRIFTRFTRLKPEDQEEMISMLFHYEQEVNRHLIRPFFNSQWVIEQGDGPSINLIFVNLSSIGASAFMHDFDLSCCKAALSPKVRTLAVTASFQEFVTTRQLRVFNVTTNEALIERFFKYVDRFNLSVVRNFSAIKPYFDLLKGDRNQLLEVLFRNWEDLGFTVLRGLKYPLIADRFQSHRLIKDLPKFEESLDRLNSLYGYKYVTYRQVPPVPGSSGNPPNLKEVLFAPDFEVREPYHIRRKFASLQYSGVEDYIASNVLDFKVYEDS